MRLETTAERLRARLGLDPLSRARLGRDVSATRVDLAIVMGKLDAADRAHSDETLDVHDEAVLVSARVDLVDVDRARRDPAVFAEVLVGEPLWPHQRAVVESRHGSGACAVAVRLARSRTLAMLACTLRSPLLAASARVVSG